MLSIPAMPDTSSVYVPDGKSLPLALERVTHLGVGAHQDDLEFMAFHGVAECFGRDDRWFGGVTCTDGRGSSRNGAYAKLSPEELGDLRRREQEEAARIGHYGIMIQLGFSSAQAVDPSSPALREQLRSIVSAAKPEVVYTHNPADKHPTHIGVFAALLQALRSLPATERPAKLIGCEVWRDLDWLCDGDKIRMNVSGHEELSQKLNAVFASQISGGKRYDLAVVGRRSANATFDEPREGDRATQVLLGMDLTPLVSDETLDVIEFIRSHIRRFENEVISSLAKYWGASQAGQQK